MEYTKYELRKHTLERPDTYVGSTRLTESDEYICTGTDFTCQLKCISYIPALLRIYIEALSNSIDNIERSNQYNIPCKYIKVNVDSKHISIKNDGMFIPVDKNSEGEWIPDMLFGELLTSSNYNDSEERTTSGRNGLGISLTNIFSSSFGIEVVDPNKKLKYTQSWFNNMSHKNDPIIKKYSKKSYTKVEWTPDFAYFGISCLSHELLYLMKRYALDAAMNVSGNRVRVYWNDILIPVKTMGDYVKQFIPYNKHISFKSPNSECILTPSSTLNNEEIVSFVNGVFTKEGGVHVKSWSNAIMKILSKSIKDKYKIKVSPNDLKKYFRFFIRCTVPNPCFDTQSKTVLVSPSLKDIPTITKKTIQPLLKWDYIELIKQQRDDENLKALRKTERKKRGIVRIEGYDAANKANTRFSKDCTLILCEGLSAKTFAVQGIQKGCRVNGVFRKGRDWFGILALRGKCLNTRNASTKSIANNREIGNLIKTLNLKYKADYNKDSEYETLSYGRVMLLCDYDVDGYHIQSLILNIFDTLFPSLLKRPGFLSYMQTPIIKLSRRNEQVRFYDIEQSKEFLRKSKYTYDIKYYKGLGTSTNEDIEKTFGEKIVIYHCDTNAEETLCQAFDKKYVSYRKEWIMNYAPQTLELTQVRDNTFSINVSDFINTELIKFSIDDCTRSLPNIMDGLKESSRKILYACMKKKLLPNKKAIKVAQLSGYVAEITKYHHGEGCLDDVITKMAQGFVGSNNLPLLESEGQFGTRLENGSDAASARYLFTKLSDTTRKVFIEEDDAILEYQNVEGDPVEPKYFVPILPLILINGSHGIGTGFSCSIPQFNPKDIIEWIRCWIQNSPTPDLVPWYRYFKGTIIRDNATSFTATGVVEKNGNKYIVSEIPIGTSIDKYKQYLETLSENKIISHLKNYTSDNTIDFRFSSSKDLSINDLALSRCIKTSNIVLFDHTETLVKLNSIDELCDTFCKVRLDYYKKRINYTIQSYEKEHRYISNKIRFIEYFKDNIQSLVKTKSLDNLLKKNNFDTHDNSYSYLVDIPIKSVNASAVKRMNQTRSQIESKLHYYKDISPCKLWMEELDAFHQTIK